MLIKALSTGEIGFIASRPLGLFSFHLLEENANRLASIVTVRGAACEIKRREKNHWSSQLHVACRERHVRGFPFFVRFAIFSIRSKRLASPEHIRSMRSNCWQPAKSMKMASA
jgi:hypothetical protein